MNRIILFLFLAGLAFKGAAARFISLANESNRMIKKSITHISL